MPLSPDAVSSLAVMEDDNRSRSPSTRNPQKKDHLGLQP